MGKIKKYGFGTRGDIPADAAESRIIPFVLSTFTKDRHGTVLNQDNWKLDNYRLNPVIAYQHTLSGGLCTDPNPDYVIGKSVSIGIEGQGQEFQKVLFGSLTRTSVGFLEVGEGKYGEGEEAQGRAEETYYFAGQELLEASIVNIPSNPQAGKRDITNRRLREEGYIAFMYAFRELGGKFLLSELEAMTVRDILTLLDGKDLEIKEKDPRKVRELLADPEAVADQVARLQESRKRRVNSLRG